MKRVGKNQLNIHIVFKTRSANMVSDAADESFHPPSFEDPNVAELLSHIKQCSIEKNQGPALDDDGAPPLDADKETDAGTSKEVSSEARAAITVQKIYRSYRTRRHLADTAVIKKKIAWWNVLEGALLRQHSETFYAYERQDTAASRWSRLKRKAAKVGKGLSKDENARKLAIQHWLEAIDPRHRYGHNLHFYYTAWEESSTKEPFFYWLDVGEGKAVDLPECKRSTMQKQQIQYLGPSERKQYEVVVDGGKLRYKKSSELVHTPKGDKWIFVMSTSGKLYVAQKRKGRFQHSSFLAGGATKAAGRLLVNNGTLELMEAHSGHYHPTEENFSDLVRVLKELGTDLRFAEVQAVSDDMLLLENENLQKVPSGIVPEFYEGVTTKEDKMEDEKDLLLQVHSKNNKDYEVATQNSGNHAKSLTDGPQDAQSLVPCFDGLLIERLDTKKFDIDSQVEPMIESTGMHDGIRSGDKPSQITL